MSGVALLSIIGLGCALVVIVIVIIILFCCCGFTCCKCFRKKKYEYTSLDTETLLYESKHSDSGELRSSAAASRREEMRQKYNLA
jgi:hypothetical protein